MVARVQISTEQQGLSPRPLRESPLAVLNHIGWLSLTPPSFQATMQRHLVPRRLEAGQPIFHVGDSAGGIWGVVEGSVIIDVRSSAQSPNLVSICAPGHWFGFGGVFSNVPRRMTARTREPSLIATVPLPQYRAIFEDEPGNWKWVALLAAIGMDFIGSMVAELMIKEPRRRIAATLLRLSGFNETSFPHPGPRVLKINQNEIGQMTNLSRAIVNNVVRQFASRGFIRLEYRRVEVLKPNALRIIVMGEGDGEG